MKFPSCCFEPENHTPVPTMLSCNLAPSTATYFLVFFLLLYSNFVICTASNASIPIATVKNGTVAGVYLPTWDQDAFLGIPYAQPPLGSLRFKSPQLLNTSYSGTVDASRYGYSCLQYGTKFNLSEDCLTLNGKSSRKHRRVDN